MPTEQRIIASKPKIGARPAPGAPAVEAEPEAAPKSKKKLVIIVVAALLLVGGGGGYWFLLGPGAGASEAQEAEPPPEPGEVLTVDPVNLNLAGGHYLRLGLGLQMTADAGGHGKVDTARALDLAIALFSGRTVEEVSDAETRDALKAELLHQLEEAYHGEVMGLYFTDYVTQ
ncbi:flagellar basal body-associated protein FliL [Actinotalea sp. K2]|uniref:flagellar basal body-associated FliL family protein n=1 Tax=Actinotalea sp. K2 TaxID=2939438 RepID=UPI002016FB7F|nr:flagellar basal body-associated FliL family protein [Actinotalea sp. K2]MCL3860867.1 flagellar basal body-associated FliL family protein [Actinotalea sp. K2]